MKTPLISATLDGSSMWGTAEVIKKQAASKFGDKVKVSFENPSSRFYGRITLSTELDEETEKGAVKFLRGIASHAVLCRATLW